MTKNGIYFRTIQRALIVGVVFSFLFSIIGFQSQCRAISQSVLRLHILANSDSPEDQELKLRVRDRILEYTGESFENAEDLSTSESIAQDDIAQIVEVAEDEIKKSGHAYGICAEIVNMHFNTREYAGVTLPAGSYDALRITIGEGKGQNWWCVLFPPMCVSAALESEEIAAVLSSEQLDIVSSPENYRLKLKSVEIIEKLKQELGL